jgi:next to BRCA1 gene 1 protein
VNCDKCGQKNFTGKRYKCLHCPDYDLCDNCFPGRSKFHSLGHPFKMVKRNFNLNQKIAKPVEEPKPVVVQPIFKPVIEETNQEPHKGVACDKCGKQNFIGKRYQCTTCSDYDLCETCFPSRSKFHSNNHPFKLVKKKR